MLVCSAELLDLSPVPTSRPTRVSAYKLLRIKAPSDTKAALTLRKLYHACNFKKQMLSVTVARQTQ